MTAVFCNAPLTCLPRRPPRRLSYGSCAGLRPARPSRRSSSGFPSTRTKTQFRRRRGTFRCHSSDCKPKSSSYHSPRIHLLNYLFMNLITNHMNHRSMRFPKTTVPSYPDPLRNDFLESFHRRELKLISQCFRLFRGETLERSFPSPSQAHPHCRPPICLRHRVST